MNDILVAMLITTVIQRTVLPIYFNDVLSQRVRNTKRWVPRTWTATQSGKSLTSSCNLFTSPQHTALSIETVWDQ
jgi:hypothetical protein